MIYECRDNTNASKTTITSFSSQPQSLIVWPSARITNLTSVRVFVCKGKKVVSDWKVWGMERQGGRCLQAINEAAAAVRSRAFRVQRCEYSCRVLHAHSSM
ncbi:hypothetical protein Pcinc_029096 [Petrolisthes cinctipes]|uniref:Uncharacterized protein n=1 Tax=Petrolisthes cinctipes TaxID=88211 RepID=A0AAE1F0S2_PETCI|nr:hypothetical protein Pcinc_029096 [Petrolisthes cinctipes]